MSSDSLTIFYSWQSDAPANQNRSFIEAALKMAIEILGRDDEVAAAVRDDVLELDKDTKGIPGSPPIADTILKKINNCGAFVADLTFVGTSSPGLKIDSPRSFPNPNVAIEYGYALSACGHERMIGVMNTHFGEPSHESLPFDLKHLRWPVTYCLSEADTDKPKIKKNLATTLADRLKPILIRASQGVETNLAKVFVPFKHGESIATHSEDVMALVPSQAFSGGPLKAVIPDEGRLYIRLYPITQVPPFETELDAWQATANGVFRPAGDARGWDRVRNRWGAIAFEGPSDGKLWRYTQLFTSKEIWGVDAHVLNKTWCMEHSGKSFGYFTTFYLEHQLVSTLDCYLSMARKTLGIPGNLRLIVGFSRVAGYRLAVSNSRIAGELFEPDLEWTTDVTSDAKSAFQILRPFFAYYWRKCGFERPANEDMELAKAIGESM